jgi:hypothetical protein
MKNLYRMLMILPALMVSTFAEAARGDRGGPGYRGPDGKCYPGKILAVSVDHPPPRTALPRTSPARPTVVRRGVSKSKG